jgi:uncharacterized YigZ family protein
MTNYASTETKNSYLMREQNYSFKTIEQTSDVELYKDKGSKFYAYAFPIQKETDVKKHIEELKEKHSSAGHFCYAYRLGPSASHYRVSDDGEPNNSAGMPILGQLQAKDLTNILVVVVRYFGGIKLGVGGLIMAYKTAAKQILETIHIVTSYTRDNIKIHFTYNELSYVMRIIKKYNLKILQQHQELACWVKISVKKKDLESILLAFSAYHKIEVEILND